MQKSKKLSLKNKTNFQGTVKLKKGRGFGRPQDRSRNLKFEIKIAVSEKSVKGGYESVKKYR